MKKSIIAFAAFLPLLGMSQSVLVENWFKTVEGPQELLDVAWGIAVDDENQAYWATTQSIDGIDVKDVVVYKLDEDGNELWSYTYGGEFEQQAYIAHLSDDVLYVGGRDFHDFSFPPFINGSDAFVFALDTTLQDTLWSWVWDGGYSYEEVDGLVKDGDYIYVSGWTEDEFEMMNTFVARLDLDGNLDWMNIWGTDQYDQQDGHMIVDDSTIYFSGMINANSVGFFGDAILVAFDKTDGSYKWEVPFGSDGPHDDGLGLNSDGDYLYQCGITNSFPDSNVFVNKYDKNGNLIWTFKTNKAIKARSLDFDSGGNIYLAATTDNEGAGAEDLIILYIDAGTGELLEWKSWGGSENESVQDIAIKDGFMYLTGRTVSYSSNTNFDALLVKAPLFELSALAESPELSSAIYPNPTSGMVSVKISDQLAVRTTVFDLQGQLVFSQDAQSGMNTLDLSDLKSGTYFVHFITETGTKTERLIIE